MPGMKLTDLTVEWISLVKRPANGRGVILKAADSRGRPLRLVKADGRLHRLYGIVYAPDEMDAHGDWADAETIRKAADDFMRSGRAPQVDQEHDFTPVPAFVAESWLVRKGDPLFPDEREGAWAVGIQIEDAELWAAIEAGEVEGISLAGTARVGKGFWQRFLQRNERKEHEMTPDEVRALVREVIDETVKAAEAETEREKLAKSLHEKAEAIEALKKTLAEKETALAELAKRIEALEKAEPKGSAEGGTGQPVESFV
jgi:hypothetical protein